MAFTRPKQRNPPPSGGLSKDSGITAIGDMDSVVYACGYAGQTTIREVWVKGETGIMQASFESAKEMDDWLKGFGHTREDFIIKERIETDPLNFVLHSTKLFVEQMLGDVQAEDYIFYLSGKDNFRYEVAKILPYKEGRVESDKPVYYKEIRKYLVDVWGAIVIDGYEADDACTIKATELTKASKKWVGMTRDKDLFQCPGKWYRY